MTNLPRVAGICAFMLRCGGCGQECWTHHAKIAIDDELEEEREYRGAREGAGGHRGVAGRAS
jgi:hypothetical protein